ncbi:MAG: hypothetical protein QXE12_05415 [Conexivisphaerales archaeon]
MVLVSVISLFLTRYVKVRSKRLSARLTSRLTEDRSLEFLTYLTQILSAGETVQLLDELMKYYTSVKAQEAERGADTVNAVLKRLETVIWELAQLLERATGIERVRSLERQINSDSGLAYVLSWLLLPESILLMFSSFMKESILTLYIVLVVFLLILLFTAFYALRSHFELNKMEKEAELSSKRSYQSLG